MFSMLNVQDRSAEEWSKIVVAADPRLKVPSIEKPPGSHDAIIEIALRQISESCSRRGMVMRCEGLRGIAILGRGTLALSHAFFPFRLKS